MTSKLADYGWNSSLEDRFSAVASPDAVPARVITTSHGIYTLQTETGRIEGILSGALRHHADGAAELPTVGDWVVATRPSGDAPALIESALPRRSRLSRKVPGKRAVEQVLAANVDVVLLVMGLDADFNLRRLERFLVMTAESGAHPVVILNKADLPVDAEGRRAEAQKVAGDAPVLLLSAMEGDVKEVIEHLLPGTTAVLVGSSGVGKSTLTNRLLGRERFAIGEIRLRDGRGQHTTTHRELVRLPSGGLLIDGPGIREIQLWTEDGVTEAFLDVEGLAAECRFRDCSHEGEPGCAVRSAMDRGELEPARLESYLRLQREAAALARRRDDRTRRAAERRQGKLYKRIQEAKRRDRDD